MVNTSGCEPDTRQFDSDQPPPFEATNPDTLKYQDFYVLGSLSLNV